MADCAKNTVDTTLEHKFAKDLIRFVLHEYMTGLQWTPTGIFAEKEMDSPFTAQFRDAVIKELENNGSDIHQIYDTYFPDKTCIKESYFEICKANKDNFVNDAFTKEEFLTLCAILAKFAGLSYLYGVDSAPYDTYMIIITAIKELKKNEKIGDTFWNEMQSWLENKE